MALYSLLVALYAPCDPICPSWPYIPFMALYIPLMALYAPHGPICPL